MNLSIISKLDKLQKRFNEIELILEKSNFISNKEYFLNLSKEYSQLKEIVDLFKLWKLKKQEIQDVKSIISEPDISKLAQQELASLILDKKKLKKKLYLY